MMALNASIVNLARGTLGSLSGILVNKYFVGASKEEFDNKDFSKLEKFIWISFGSIFINVFFMRLIPIKKDVE